MMADKRRILLIIFWGLVISCMIAIFMLSNEDATDSEGQSGGLIAKIRELFSIELSQFVVRKIGHTIEYFSLCILFNLAYGFTYKRFSPLISFVSTAFYASTDEIHQFFIEGRACQLRDVFIDSTGALCGIAFCFIVISVYKIIRNKREVKICQY